MEEEADLPPRFALVLDDYGRHLEGERDLSGHTVRAYLADVGSVLRYAAERGCASLEGIDLRLLRGWLAQQQAAGSSRTSLARRATAARVFTS